MAKDEGVAKNGNGFKLRLFGAIVVLLSAIAVGVYANVLQPVAISSHGQIIEFYLQHSKEFFSTHYAYTGYVVMIFVVFAIILFIMAFVGKKKKGASVTCVVFGVVISLAMLVLLITAAVGSTVRQTEMQSIFYNLAEIVRPNINYDVFPSELDIKIAYSGFGVAFSPYVWFSVAAVGGLLSVIGGVIGSKRSVVQNTVEEEQAAPCQTGTAASDTISAQPTGNTQLPIETQSLEYITPKISDKGKKMIMIALIMSYSLLAIAAVLFIAVPSMGWILVSVGMVKDVQARAYAISIGMMWLAVLPSIGYYFATVSPYKLGKGKKRVIFGVCAALSVVVVATYFIVAYLVHINHVTIQHYYDESDKWFLPLSIVFAVIAIAICYILTMLKLNPAAIKTVKPQKNGEGFLAAMKHLLATILYGMKKIAKNIFAFKEKLPDVFVLVSSIALTWFVYFVSFVFAILALCLVVMVIVMYVGGVIQMSYTPSSTKQKQIYENGQNVTLTYSAAQSSSDCEVYEDNFGHKYYSNDGGKTVVKE